METFEIKGSDGSSYDVQAPDFQSAVAAFKKMQGMRTTGPMPPETRAESASDYIPRAISDVPNEIRNAFNEGVSGVKSGFLDRDPTKESPLGSILKTGSGLLSAASLPFTPIIGAGRSLLGHPLASASEAIGGIINPDVKDSHDKIYEEIAPRVDLAMSAIAANRPMLGPPAPPPQAPVAKAISDLRGMGHDIDVPRVVTSENLLTQRVGSQLRNVPYVGDPIVKKTEAAVEQLANVPKSIAQAQGGRTMESAGNVAATGITDWTGPKSKALVKQAYDAVDAVVNPAIRTDLAETRGVIANIAARRQNAMIQGDSPAVNAVIDAVQSPSGLNYAGVKDLRTHLGEMLENPSVMPAGWKGSEVKQIYGALSKDLRVAAENAGGPRGLQLFERANKLNEAVQGRREQLAGIVGLSGDASPAQVFDRIRAAASSKSRADTALLMNVRKTLGGDWDDVASGVTTQLGINAKGDFSPAIYLNNWNALSDAGKAILYPNRGHRKALDAVAEISSRTAVDLAKFANPSGTGQTSWAAIVGAGVWADPITALTTAVGGNVAARILASPAPAASFAQWSKAYARAVRAPSPGSASLLTIATRNLTNTIGSNVGVTISPAEFLKLIQQGPVPARSEDDQPK